MLRKLASVILNFCNHVLRPGPEYCLNVLNLVIEFVLGEKWVMKIDIVFGHKYICTLHFLLSHFTLTHCTFNQFLSYPFVA